jgi:hypothetical protein
MISITGNQDRKEKLKKLREFHQKTLNELGVPDAIFIPKMAYTPTGKSELFIGFFNNEISKGQDIFTEFCSRDNDPEYEDRGLYRWKYNSHFEEEYEKTAPNSTGSVRYLVPVSELIKVKSYTQSESEVPFNIMDPDSDAPMDQMTLRDYAAIHLGKPVSMKPWLNEIIKHL